MGNSVPSTFETAIRVLESKESGRSFVILLRQFTTPAREYQQLAAPALSLYTQ